MFQPYLMGLFANVAVLLQKINFFWEELIYPRFFCLEMQNSNVF